MYDLRRGLCSILAGVLSAAVIYFHAQFPRATITLEPGPPKEFMFGSPRDIHFLPGSRRLITKDWHQAEGDFGEPVHFRLRLWNAHNGRFMASILEGPDHQGLVFAPDGAQFTVRHQETTIWDADRGKPRLKFHVKDEFTWIFYLRDKVCCMDVKSEIHDLESGEIFPVLDKKLVGDLYGQLRKVSHSGLWLLDNPIRVIDPVSGKFLLELTPEQMGAWRKWEFSSDGRALIARRGRSNIATWNIETQTPSRYELTFTPSHFSIAPDGKKMATAYGTEERSFIRRWLLWCNIPVKDSDFRVKVYDMPTGEVLFERYGAILGVFAPDGKTLAVLRDDNVVELWDWPIRAPWLSIAITATLTMGLILWSNRGTLRRAKQR